MHTVVTLVKVGEQTVFLVTSHVIVAMWLLVYNVVTKHAPSSRYPIFSP
jgi:hypothetical protein